MVCERCQDTGRVIRPLSHNLVESCNNCRVFSLEWQPYHDELRRRWLVAQERENRITPAQEKELEVLNKKLNTES